MKHKKWLSDLQKTKDKLEVEYLEEAKRKEEAQQKVTICKHCLPMVTWNGFNL